MTARKPPMRRSTSWGRVVPPVVRNRAQEAPRPFPLNPLGLGLLCDGAPYELERGGIRYSVRVLLDGVASKEDAAKLAEWLRHMISWHMGVRLSEIPPAAERDE